MKALFRKISALFMALVVMFSTMSFSINKHYCMDHLVDVSLILPAENCGMDMIITDTEEGSELTATPCCSDEHIAVEGQDELSTSSAVSNDIDKVFATAFVYSYVLLFEPQIKAQPDFKAYRPPLITKDLPVLFETYLI